MEKIAFMFVAVNLSLIFLLGKQEISWYCHERMNALIKKKILKTLVCVMSGIFLVACQTSTPASRIAEHPAMFKSLPLEQQVLVRQGKLCEGMSEDAVFLAWGRPDVPPVDSHRNGKVSSRWIYRGYEPVTVINDTPWSYAGPYWGPYGGWWYAGPTYSTAFIPRTAASVDFVNGKVKSWVAPRNDVP